MMDNSSQPQQPPQPPPQPQPTPQPLMQPQPYYANQHTSGTANSFNQPSNQATAQQNPSTVQFSYDSNPFTAAAKSLGTVLIHNPIPMLLTQIIPSIVSIVGTYIIIFTDLAGMPAAINILVVLIITVILIVTTLKAFSAGFAIYRASMQGRKITTSEALNAYSTGQIIRLVLTSIVAGILITLGMFAFIIPGLIIFARLSLIPFVVFEERLSTFSAIKRSWSLTKGHIFEMWGVAIASMILSGNGLLATPAYLAGFGSRYTQIKQAKELNMSTGRLHYMNWLLLLLGTSFVALYFITIILVIAVLT